MKASSSEIEIGDDWIQVHRHRTTGIESVHAHFQGHAYDPHDHDEVLVGITQQGVQRFLCHRALHTSTPGRSILIEPGAVHDGHAPEREGFTYAMLYLPLPWIANMAYRLELPEISTFSAFKSTLTDDAQLSAAIQQAFLALHANEGQLACDQSLDHLLALLSGQLRPELILPPGNATREVMRARDLLHARMEQDIGLDDLAADAGIDRFRLTRQFKQVFGLSPHAYLVRLRLRTARALLASGREPALVAMDVGFADQSHLGRWFQRAYRLTPAAYQRRCTNILD